MRPHFSTESLRLTSTSALGRLLGGATLLAVALSVVTCGQDQMVGPAGPTKLVISVQPSSATAGASIAPAIRVEARDANNGLATTYSGAMTVAVANNPSAGTLSGTLTVSAVGGVATFDDLSINRSGAGYSLSFSSGGLTAATSASFDIEAGPASKLVYTVEPSVATAGDAINPALQIEARDAFDNRDPNFTGLVAVAITSGTGAAGATLSGTASVAAVAGVAAFDDLSIDKSGAGYTLDVSSGSLTAATSAPFDVDPGAASQLVFGIGPSDASAGAVIAPAIQVIAQDAQGNTATGFTGDVTIAIAANPGGGALSGTATVAAVDGVATFNDLSIDIVGNGYTLAVSGTGLTGATSAAFAIATGQLSQLVFTVEPANATAGQTIAPAVEVTAQDQFGNTVTTFTDNVTITIAGGASPAGPAGASANSPVISGTTTVAAVGGVATFSDLRIEQAGAGYSLQASAGTLTSPASQTFGIDPEVANHLVFSVEPSDATAGGAMTVEVTAFDAYDNVATSFTGDVTVAIATNPGGGALSGTATVAAVAGVAMFSNLSIDLAGTGYTLSAGSSGMTDIISAAFDIIPAAASRLVITQGPTTTMAGQPITPSIEVTAQDANGNTVTDFTGNVTMTIGANPGAGVLSGTTVAPAVAGVVTFSDLSINQAAAGYQLQAASATLTSQLSAAFDITPGPATEVSFTGQPSDAQAGAPIAPAVAVAARDAFGNAATGFTGDVTVSITAGTGTAGAVLSGTQTRPAVAGVATFDDLSLDKAGTAYTFSAAAGGLAGATSGIFDITFGSATQLVFMQEPSTATAGQSIAPAVKVAALDASGNAVSDFTGNVTVAITAGSGTAGAVLSGSATVAAVAGVATFNDLSIDKSGTGYTLNAASGSLTEPTSAAFAINPAQATQLVFTGQPSDQTAGQSIAPAVEVTARDPFGNTATGFTGNVTVAITSGTGAAGAVLSGANSLAAVAGVATFSDLSIDKNGTGYTLDGTSTGLPLATSGSFDILVGSGTQLVFTQDPTTATAGESIAPVVEVSVLDAAGNVATNFTENVTVAITAGTGTAGAVLSGTATAAAVAGVATFNDLSIDKSGTGYSLTASSGALTEQASAAFDINHAQASQLVFTGQPSDQTAGQSIAPAVALIAQDAFGNTATGFTGNVTASITAGTGTAGAVLSGTQTRAAVAGVATFDDLSIDKSGTGYTLDGAATGLALATSGSFAINPDVAAELVFTADPTDAIAAAAISPAVEVTLRDQFGNIATGFTGNVALAITSGTGTAGAVLSGTQSQAAVAGVATFNDLSIDKSGTGYTLTASSGALAEQTSAAFDINPAQASQLVFTGQPSDQTAGQSIAPAAQVTVQDALGNTVTDFTDNVTLAITSGTGTAGAVLSGTLTRAAVAGVATFDDLSIDKSGTGYTLDGTHTSLPMVTSASFAINHDVAAELVFTADPSDGVAATPISPAVEVTLRDQFGNIATGFIGDVTVDITGGTGTAGAVLSGNLTMSAVSGVATFSDLSIDKSGTAYTLSATSGALPTAASAAFNIAAAGFSQLVFSVQPPASSEAGAAFAVEVTAQDAQGNTVTDFTGDVTATLGANPPGGTLAGTMTVAAVAGVASFNDLNIAKAGTGYQLQAFSGLVASPFSSAFDITPAAATQLIFTGQPTAQIAGAVIGPAVEATALDQFGNTATAFTGDVMLAIGTNPGAGTLSGTATRAAVAGVATFADLSIDKSGTGYTLTASSGALAQGTSAAFDITSSAATKLAFTAEPVTTVAGQPITPEIRVTALDAFDNVVPDFTGNIALAIDNNAGSGTLSGTSSVAAVGGTSAFSDLSIDKTGTGYTLAATSGALAGAISAAFDITAAAAAKLAVTVEPTGATAGNGTIGGAISPAVEVSALDAFDNLVPSFAGDVTLAITAGSGTAGATLFGTATRAAVSGVATFAGLSIDFASPTPAGTNPYTLSASAPALTGATSAAFEINADAATQLAITVQPETSTAGNGTVGGVITPSVQISALDALGNTDPNFAAPVTLALVADPSGGTAVLANPTETAVNGVATFPGLAIDSVGTGYTLRASGGAMTSPVSSAFDIIAGPAASFIFTEQPTDATANATISPAIKVTALDAVGNLAAGFTGNVTASITSGTGAAGAQLSGKLTWAAEAGVATFPTLKIDLPSPLPAGTNPYTLTATSSGLPAAVSAPFEITASEPTQLFFQVQPSTTTAGAPITPPIQVVARDASGQTVTSFGSNGDEVTLTITTNPSGGTLSGTATKAAASGVASFSDLAIDKAGSAYKLTAEITAGPFAGMGITGVSKFFNINPGAPAKLAFNVQPSTANASAIITPQVEVIVQDALDNTVTGFLGDVTMAITGGTGTAGAVLSGTTIKTVANGIASFADLSIDLAGAGYTLSASAPGPLAATSASFDIAPGTADRLVFTQPPTNATAGVVIVPAIEVRVQDALGFPVAGFPDPVTLTITAGSGTNGATLSGTRSVIPDPTTGVATFPGLSIDKAGTGYRLSATAPGASGATSTTFVISAAAASRLDFKVQPITTQAGAVITPAVEVEVEDDFGNRVKTFTGDITVSILDNPSNGTLSGTATVSLTPADQGIGVFSNLSIDKSGTGYRLEAASLGLISESSNAFSINAGPADHLIFSVAPSDASAGAVISPAVRVTAVDVLGNEATSYVGNMSVSITPGTGTAGATLGGITTQAAAGGVAIFNDLTVDLAGNGYTLRATDTTLTPVESTTFDIFP